MQRKTSDVILGGGRFTVRVCPVLKDNFSYVIRCHATNMMAIVDVPEHTKVLAECKAMGGVLEASSLCCLTTHKHSDHACNPALLSEIRGIDIYAGALEPVAATKATKLLDDGDKFTVGELTVKTMHTPCHTKGHVCFHVSHPSSEADGAVFTGDTLFVAGLGAFFEGDAKGMITAMRKLATLPPATRVFCGHEYTLNFLKFAAQMEPSNAAISQWRSKCIDLHSEGLPTIPSTMADEKEINPFMRAALGVKELLTRLPASATASDVAAMEYLYNLCP